jgi:hypothetical protein
MEVESTSTAYEEMAFILLSWYGSFSLVMKYSLFLGGGKYIVGALDLGFVIAPGKNGYVYLN